MKTLLGINGATSSSLSVRFSDSTQREVRVRAPGFLKGRIKVEAMLRLETQPQSQ